MTKEQERKALDKIKKILEELGEDSYIGMAFEGCVKDAESNIDDDAAYSMASRWESEKKKTAAMAIEIETLKADLADYKADLADYKEALQEMSKERDQFCELLHAESKSITIKVTGENERRLKFKSLQYHDSNGFQFITLTEPSGWITSIKFGDIEALEIN